MSGIQTGIITDVDIQNPSTETIDMLPTSTIVIGVNEIQSGARGIEH